MIDGRDTLSMDKNSEKKVAHEVVRPVEFGLATFLSNKIINPKLKWKGNIVLKNQPGTDLTLEE